ncbi:MAG: hypothetical protein HRT89_04435 [Lentisphaeria bacterium]|nr:hypothetical protein [Lentisphaeria bacterium]NQZ67294.1 hypothetical protein [Lentisphaeria bacterium]
MIDIREFESWILDYYEPAMRINGVKGDYLRDWGEEKGELYGLADMACTLYTLNVLNPDEAELNVWKEGFKQYEKEDGQILEHVMVHGPPHNCAMALGAMNLLGIKPTYPLTFMDHMISKEGLLEWLKSLDWVDNTYSASHDGSGLACCMALVPETVPKEWFDWYFDFCDSMFDPKNGMMGTNKPPEGDKDGIGGTFHYQFIYEHFNRPVPYPEARIDSVLGLQMPEGDWSGGRSWWMTLDALYMLTRSVWRCHHRADDVAEAVRRAARYYTDNVLNPDYRAEHFEGFYGVHNVNACISLLAECQIYLGNHEIITERPLKSVLDKRPFI